MTFSLEMLRFLARPDIQARTRLFVDVVPRDSDCVLLWSDASFVWKRVACEPYWDFESQAWVSETLRIASAKLCWWAYDQRDGSEIRSDVELPLDYYQHFSPDLETYISQAELVAAIAPFYTRPELFAGRCVVHWCDNTAALSGLVHGYSGKPDMARLINLFHVACIALDMDWYGEWVPSKANIADLPTRADRAHEIPDWIPWVPLVLPPAHLTVGGLDDWLLAMDGRLAAARERDGW